MRSQPCNSCDGHPGTGRCAFCHGAGTNFTGRECLNCQGSGNCKHCEGQGGSGILLGFGFCLNCHGSGATLTGDSCLMCHGTGKTDTSPPDLRDHLEPFARLGGWVKALLKAVWGSKSEPS